MSDLRDKIARTIRENRTVKFTASDGYPSVGFATDEELADAVLSVLDLDTVRAEAVREAARYIERITPKGLVDRADVLADLTIAADRLESGIHANGRERKAGQ